MRAGSADQGERGDHTRRSLWWVVGCSPASSSAAGGLDDAGALRGRRPGGRRRDGDAEARGGLDHLQLGLGLLDAVGPLDEVVDRGGRALELRRGALDAGHLDDPVGEALDVADLVGDRCPARCVARWCRASPRHEALVEGDGLALDASARRCTAVVRRAGAGAWCRGRPAPASTALWRRRWRRAAGMGLASHVSGASVRTDGETRSRRRIRLSVRAATATNTSRTMTTLLRNTVRTQPIGSRRPGRQGRPRAPGSNRATRGSGDARTPSAWSSRTWRPRDRATARRTAARRPRRAPPCRWGHRRAGAGATGPVDRWRRPRRASRPCCSSSRAVGHE